MKFNKEIFVEKSKKVHGDKYDYSKVEYVNDRSKVIIICEEHGEFEQIPNTHYRSGCPLCGILKRSISRKNNADLLINRFMEKHGDKYDYSYIKYIKMKEKVNIKCNKHNLYFLQTPEKHLDSKTGGCPKCNTIGKGILGIENFIEKSNKIHNNKYDYSLSEYIKSSKKIKIICNEHGMFEMTPNAHLGGSGCKRCAGNYKYSIEDLIKIFNRLYENKYEYNFEYYTNIKSKIIAKCKLHSYFETTGASLINGYGCSSCGKKSIGEEKVSKYLAKNNIDYQKQKSFDGCVYVNKMQFDFYIPLKNICIEYDGKQHFEPIEWFGGKESFDSQKEKDLIKDNFCIKNNIKLIRIPYYEYDNVEKILDNEL